jgi:hypothetical protein
MEKKNMWELLIFIGIGVPILYFLFYAIYSQNVKIENEFARDVYYYLIRRYPETKILDHGGFSSDPLIESQNAGPFSILEVKVVTNKQNGKSDRDLVLRGVVDETKHERGNNLGSNILISPRISWMKSNTIVQTGQPDIDKRFKTSCNNQIFARDLIQSDLGDLLKRNYDVEAYSLHWYDNGSLAIQIKMETMNSNSFFHAYNIALASIGTLIQKGYLTRTGIRTVTKDLPTPKIPIPVIKPITPSSKPKIEWGIEEPVDKLKPIPTVELQPVIDQQRLGKTPDQLKIDEISSLFTLIRYQAKNIEFLSDSVVIHTFSSQVPKIIVTFPTPDQIMFQGTAIQNPEDSFILNILNPNPSQSPSWSDPWKDIQLQGSEPLLERLKFRTAIANKISEIGNITIQINGSQEGLTYLIQIRKDKKSISAGYSLFNDLIWFFEMLL